jgi:hypothetical protein
MERQPSEHHDYIMLMVDELTLQTESNRDAMKREEMKPPRTHSKRDQRPQKRRRKLTKDDKKKQNCRERYRMVQASNDVTHCKHGTYVV